MAPPICKFFQNGNCRNGANCRFSHPGASTNPFSAANANSFSALASGSGGSKNPKDGGNPYKISRDQIKADLADERPSWILSAYAPGRDAPRQLWGGKEREMSFEEVRLFVTGSPNQQEALQHIGQAYQNAEQQTQNALNNLDGAVDYILSAENDPENRMQICKRLSSGETGVFAKDRTSTGFTNPLNNALSGNQNAFGPTQASPFGTGAGSTTNSVFGQSSALGAKPSPFGAPAFGQPSQLGNSPTAFGQPSQLGNKPSAFGQPSALGTAVSGSAFGQSSALGAKPSPFGAPAFGQPSQLGNSSPAFGQPSQLGGTGPAFGTVSALGTKPSPFGAAPSPSAFGPGRAQSNTFAKPSPFSNTQTTPSPFGAPSQAQNAGQKPTPFGQPSFGQPSQPNTDLGQPSTFGQKPNPFGSMQATSADQSMDTSAPPATTQPNTFGQPSATGFGQPAKTNGFGGGVFGGLSITGSGAPAQQGQAATGDGGPYAPNSTKKHPDASTYLQRKQVDNGIEVVRFKGRPVMYKDGNPYYQAQDGTSRRIWMPTGPPPYYRSTEPENPSDYNANVKAAYQAMNNNGFRFQGDMPTVPPMREDCLFDF